MDNTLKLHDFDYHLPESFIAQTPMEPRDHSRLLVADHHQQSWAHRHFYDLIDYLQPGDLLIANQSRVIPARLLGQRSPSGGNAEVLLLSERLDKGANYWEALVRPGRRLREGSLIHFCDQAEKPLLQAEILERTARGGRLLHLTPLQGSAQAHDPQQRLLIQELIDQLGRMPLPPYIHEQLENPERYQTVYARIRGSAAAPTAGLHFTPELLGRLTEKGVQVGFVTLHVGLDTFRPMEHENISEHVMHSEEIELNEETAKLIQATKNSGGRVIAVGTTSVRVLESVGSIQGDQIAAYSGQTRLFITPGYQFKIVDAMITNFHLPHSTLLLLVSAFMGKDFMQSTYAEAIRENYRFYSFGDALLLL